MRAVDADKLLEEWDERTDDHRITDSEFHRMINEDLPLIELGWHYPSKGEYPTEGEKVLILYKDDDGVLDTCLGDYSYCEPAEDESFKADFYWNKENLDPLDDRQVECWQYIVPPEEV